MPLAACKSEVALLLSMPHNLREADLRLWMTLALAALLAMPVAAQDRLDPEFANESEIGDGLASYYGNELAGNLTASGEAFNPDQLTAAHRTLAFGSKVRVTNLSNGQSVIVRINDRGPFGRGRVIDVSQAAAREIGLHRSGTARVRMTLVDEHSDAD